MVQNLHFFSNAQTGAKQLQRALTISGNWGCEKVGDQYKGSQGGRSARDEYLQGCPSTDPAFEVFFGMVNSKF